MLDRLKRKKREGLSLFDSDDYLESIYHFITTGHPSWRYKNVCDSPNLYFAVLPDASFAPCCDHRFSEKIYVYDDDFPKIYKSKEFRRKVRAITKKCPGCNFGSYPEMTLSARSAGTIWERVRLQLKTRKSSIKPLEEDKLFRVLDEVKSDYEIYQKPLEFKGREAKKWPKASNIPERLWNE